jgi:hypothetical protein
MEEERCWLYGNQKAAREGGRKVLETKYTSFN